MNGLGRQLLSFTLLTLLAAFTAQAQTTPTPAAYYFGTWAGASSRGTADGAGSAARFFYPSDLTIDSTGNLFVADMFNHTIRKITAGGVVSTLAGSPGESGSTNATGSAARFYLPSSIVLHTDGNLYVGEGSPTGGGRIRRVTRDGVVTLLAGGEGTQPVDGVGTAAVFEGGTLALESEASGTLLAADPRTIRRVEMNGTVTTLFRKDDVWMNSLFAAIVRDPSGNIYVACNGLVPQTGGSARNQARIYRLSPTGGVTTYADETNGLAGVGHLYGLALDAQQNVYAAGSSAAIYRFSGGNMTVYAGMPGTIGARDGTGTQAQFSSLLGLAFDSAGNLFASELNNTIRRITPAAAVSTVAGIPEEDSARHWDARGTAARFDTPAAIAINRNGVAYVADQFNHVIRQIMPDGTVTTLAGAPGQAGYVDAVGADARFNFPRDLSVDASGTIYVIEDSGAVRKITPAGSVSTLAGRAARGPTPAQDGAGNQATFGVLTAVVATAQGDVYVAEAASFSPTLGSTWARVRKITSAGVVSTIPVSTVYPHTYFSGMTFDRNGVLYLADPEYQLLHRVAADGTSESIRLNNFTPARLAADANGNFVITEDRDYGAGRVARYTSAGALEIIGGARYATGHHDGVGARARFTELSGIAVDAEGALYLTDTNNTVRKAVAASAPTITTQPANQTVANGSAVTFSVAATAMPEPTYQWFFNGTAIAGATTSGYTITAATNSQAGNYHVVVTNELGSATSATATLTVNTPSTGGGASSGSGSGGGGGGAPSIFFLLTGAALACGRWLQRHRACQP